MASDRRSKCVLCLRGCMDRVSTCRRRSRAISGLSMLVTLLRFRTHSDSPLQPPAGPPRGRAGPTPISTPAVPRISPPPLPYCREMVTSRTWPAARGPAAGRVLPRAGVPHPAPGRLCQARKCLPRRRTPRAARPGMVVPRGWGKSSCQGECRDPRPGAAAGPRWRQDSDRVEAEEGAN